MLLIRAKLRSALVSRQWLWGSSCIKCGPSSCLAFYKTYLSFSGPRSRLSHQSHQNVICVKGLKRGGYKTFGSKNPLNPNEKAKRANGWVISTWTNPGIRSFGSPLFRQHCIIIVRRLWKSDGSLYAFRPFLLDVWMWWFLSFPIIVSLDKQYEGAAERMRATFKLVKEQDPSELSG